MTDYAALERQVMPSGCEYLSALLATKEGTMTMVLSYSWPTSCGMARRVALRAEVKADGHCFAAGQIWGPSELSDTDPTHWTATRTTQRGREHQ